MSSEGIDGSQGGGELVQQHHAFVGMNSLLFVVLVVGCMFVNRELSRRKMHYMPGTVAFMIIGFFIGLLLALFGKHESSYVSFSPSIFFFILLPPIIFDAGYSLKKKNFFKNFSTINLFAVGGTIVSTFVIGFSLYACAYMGIVPLDSETPIECLMFGALISAVDPVATLSILGDENINSDEMLYSLVFGESVLNDAVAVVLFKTFEGYADKSDIEGNTGWYLVANFIGISIGSIGIGVVVALACSFIFKNTDIYKQPSNEFILAFLFAYASYCISEIISLSGIMTLFFCGIVLGHYNHYNLSKISQQSMKHVLHSFSTVCETFLFAYLGMTAAVSFQPQFNLKWSVALITITSVLCVVSRALNIFPFSAIANLRRRRKITLRMQIIMWFAGLRGAIAFALALTMSTPHRAYIVTTTLAIVFLTTFACGGFTATLMTRLGMNRSVPEGQFQRLVSPRPSVPMTPNGLHTLWKDFDDNFLKEMFGGAHHGRDRDVPANIELFEDDSSALSDISERDGI